MTDKAQPIEEEIEEQEVIVEGEDGNGDEVIDLAPEQSTQDIAKQESNAERRARRKEEQRQAKERDKAEIDRLRRANEELALRMNQFESRHNSRAVQNDIESQESLIANIKAHMAQVEDRSSYVELTDKLADEKLKLRELKQAKERSEKIAPRKDAISADAARLARDWSDKHAWFNPKGQGTDSKIALAVDAALTEEGFDSTTERYWTELDKRLQDALPHRYNASRRSPVTSSRGEKPYTARSNSEPYVLSAERKKALQDRGYWDDPVKRAEMIKVYREWDRENLER